MNKISSPRSPPTTPTNGIGFRNRNIPNNYCAADVLSSSPPLLPQLESPIAAVLLFRINQPVADPSDSLSNSDHFEVSIYDYVWVPVGCSINPLNYMGNEQVSAPNRPVKRSREPEPISRHQKLQISLNNNFCHDEAGQTGSILNPNGVSTGLRLSYEEDEHNSSITSAGENMKAALPGIFSVGDSLKIEIDRQTEEFDQYIRVQEDTIMKGLRDLKQRQTTAFLNVLEKGVRKKLHEKELEIETMNRKNKELGEKIKQVATEAQSWHYRAKYNESVVNVLKSNLQQVIAQSAVQVKEGCGDSEVDDAASYISHHQQVAVGGSGNPDSMKLQLNCRVCKSKEVSVLLLPCRHLCLCKDCEGFIDVCPVCAVLKTTSVQVYIS